VSANAEQVKGLELNKHGAPESSVIDVTAVPTTSNLYAPCAAGSTDAAEWLVNVQSAADQHYVQIVGTSSTGGGSDLRLSDCYGPDPFASLGGGTCGNGGWLPPGMGGLVPIAEPPDPTGNTGCSIADPFASLGAGTCHNGGWLPPGMVPAGQTPPPTPDEPPTPAGCTGTDPFAALGGGTCHNGGWLPPGMTAPTGGNGACTTPDPFASLPDLVGECRNGGWVPVAAKR
jgi:hypothetical protein